MTSPADDKPARRPAPHPGDQSASGAAPSTPPPRDPDPPPPAATRPKTAAVDNIVQELRQELAHISAHEIDLRRREEEFDEEYRRLEQAARRAARAEVQQVQQQLVQRTAALNAQTAALTARRAQLNALANELEQREQRLATEHAEVVRYAADVDRRVQVLRKRFQTERAALRRRIGTVRQQETELGRRMQLARNQIARQRAELQQQEADLQARLARVGDSEQSAQAHRQEIERRLTEEAARVAALSQQTGELVAEQARLAEERQRLRSAAGDVDAQRSALVDRQRELDRRWHAAREQRQELVRQVDELEARRRNLQAERTDTSQRAAALAQREQQLHQQAAGLEAERQRLQALEADLVARQAAVDDLQRRAAEQDEAARRALADVHALREQTEIRDGESRQAALALEVERQEVQRSTAALEKAEQEFDGVRAQRDRDHAEARRLLIERAARLTQAERLLVAAPRLWWARSTGLALAVAVVVGAGWLNLHPPRYQTTIPVQIRSAPPAPETTSAPAGPAAADTPVPADWAADILAEHSRLLLDPQLLGDESSGALAPHWRQACATRQVLVTPGVAPLTLQLAVTDLDRARAIELARTAAEVYAHRINGVQADLRLPPAYQDFLAWRDELETALAQRRQQRVADETALSTASDPAERTRQLAAVNDLERELGATSTGLSEQRSHLAVLLAAQLPPGTVDPATVAGALREDAVFQEDHKQLETAAAAYRTELLVGLLLATDTQNDVRKALTQFADSVAEQRKLTPPTELVATLESCAADLKHAQERVGTFAQEWRALVEAVQGLDLSTEAVELSVVDLVRRQSEAATVSRQVTDGLTTLVEQLGQRVDGLGGEGSGGTRAVVVAAVLRSDHVGLKTTVESLAQAVAKVAPAGNVELDAHDRQIRGLRTRLTQRRDLVTGRLQMEADRSSREQHTAQVDTVRQEVLRLEQRREELTAQLTAALRSVRELDTALRRREQLAGRLEQDDAEIAQLQTQIQALEAKLADARRHGPQPDRVELGPAQTSTVSQPRLRPAILAAVLAGAAAWVVSFAMIARNPWRRDERQRLAEILGESPTAGLD